MKEIITGIIGIVIAIVVIAGIVYVLLKNKKKKPDIAAPAS